MHTISKEELMFYGGYGEHGRSCFVIARENGRYIIVDCGILDTDPNPYPEVPTEILSKTDYLLITHCHKDHIGALEYFVKQGFSGTVITEEITLQLYHIDYLNCKTLLCDGVGKFHLESGLVLRYGRSGHCPGSLWFQLTIDAKSYLFSGDYQADTLVNAVDKVEGFTVDTAIVDCGHEDIMISASACREQLIVNIKEFLDAGKTVILPTQQYGRGMELLWLIQKEFPNIICMADQKFIEHGKKSLIFERSYKTKMYLELRACFKNIKAVDSMLQGIVFLSDTHLEKEGSIELVKSFGEHAMVITTGRIKENGRIGKLLADNKAIYCPYSHHQSEYDFKQFMEENNCKIVYPYHGHQKRVFKSS